MRFGFSSGILHPMPLSEIMSFSIDNNLGEIEVMSWPKSDNVWGGMTHLDVDEVLDGNWRGSSDMISALTYYSNPLHPNADNAQKTIRHIEKLIAVAGMLDIPVVNTYAGMDYDRSWEDNYLLFHELWVPLVERAKFANVTIAIKNSPASFNNGAIRNSNLAKSPSVWEKMFDLVPSQHFGLDYDPAYMISQHMDYVMPIFEFADQIKFVQARDVTVNKYALDRVGTQSAIDEYTEQEVIGDGCINWRRVKQALESSGYSGHVSIDILKRGDVSTMKRSLKRAFRALKAF